MWSDINHSWLDLARDFIWCMTFTLETVGILSTSQHPQLLFSKFSSTENRDFWKHCWTCVSLITFGLCSCLDRTSNLGHSHAHYLIGSALTATGESSCVCFWPCCATTAFAVSQQNTCRVDNWLPVYNSSVPLIAYVQYVGWCGFS